jgi:two-component system response regulator HydG
VIAATNKNLEEQVQQGQFREDLFYRLNVIPLYVPALRERPSDIPLLIEHFVRHFARRHNKSIKGMSLAARVKLGAFAWPGNVRQLRNVIESMVVVDCDEMLDLDDLPLELEPAATAPVAGGSAAPIEMQAGLAALVGRPHKSLGEEPVAFVTLAAGASATAAEWMVTMRAASSTATPSRARS